MSVHGCASLLRLVEQAPAEGVFTRQCAEVSNSLHRNRINRVCHHRAFVSAIIEHLCRATGAFRGMHACDTRTVDALDSLVSSTRSGVCE